MGSEQDEMAETLAIFRYKQEREEEERRRRISAPAEAFERMRVYREPVAFVNPRWVRALWRIAAALVVVVAVGAMATAYRLGFSAGVQSQQASKEVSGGK